MTNFGGPFGWGPGVRPPMYGYPPFNNQGFGFGPPAGVGNNVLFPAMFLLLF
ncbi:hypothetical protein PU629_10775 [Pullulanibacillus sp. KACC 23026]|uniref:hypothetical protein n=1 Tax=Pullulanibacillus sp. KACC 23026 TaxID=3028315 RepID=UPI0023B0C75D|nr:hypothetical protein [Pullulanibacillus sp. KACC 23026]WEG14794.1 hypothetical protein PU629_10775 [Pullulanibacillus sp. KACC 23026]